MKSIKNKYLFFLLRFIKDFTNPISFDIAGDMKSQKLGEYYFLFEESKMFNQKGGQKSIVLDYNGIPMNPTYIDVKDKKFVYFPITIGQYGLAVFHTYIRTGAEKDKNRFLSIAKWFEDNGVYNEKLGRRWLTDVALPQYKNPGPWQSAFVQSRAISVFLRAFQLTKDQKYAVMAEEALKPYLIPVSEGGVTSFTQWGPFYEEYTSSVPTLVLNGMIFALCGVADFVRVFPDNESAVKILKDGISTLKSVLPTFDLGYWSRYNLCNAEWYPETDPATIAYQRLHVTQLRMMHRLTDDDIFLKYADKFKRQDNLFNALRMYLVKYKALKKLGRL